MQLGASICLSGSWVWYRATNAGDKVRLSAYSTTSLSFDAHSSTPMAGFSCGLRTSRSSASR